MVKLSEGEMNGKKKKCAKVGGCKLFYEDDVQLEEELYRNYAEALLEGKVTTKSFLGSTIQKSLQRISIGVDKDPKLALSALRELGRISSKTQEFYDRKKETDTDFSKYLLRESLIPWQKDFYDDTSLKITELCGRRSGKSQSIIRKALKHCLLPPIKTEAGEKKRTAVIIGLTFEKTVALYWDAIKQNIEKAHINTRLIDNGGAKVTFPNGNTLFLYGNNNKADREKLRGFDISFVAIDECQSQSALLYLYESILAPQLKGTKGELVLAGTAPLYAGSFWERCVLDDTFTHYHTTMEDNPFIPDYEHALDDILKENNWTKDNIVFRREYLGEIAYDTNRMIISKNTYFEEIPSDFKARGCVIAFDPGWQDFSSFVAILYNDTGECYLYDVFREQHVASSKLVEMAKKMIEEAHHKFNIPKEDIHIVQDTSHQMILADLFNQTGFTNIEPAYKIDEKRQWDRLSEACYAGYFHCKKGDYFDQECKEVVWQFDEEKQCVIYKIDETVQHPHVMDSVKYAYEWIYSNVLNDNYNSSIDGE